MFYVCVVWLTIGLLGFAGGFAWRVVVVAWWGGWLVCFVLDCAGRLLLSRGCLLCVLIAVRLGGGCMVVVLGSRLLVG